MRVPIPIVLLLCVVMLGGTWWNWTRGKDFVSPPSEETLTALRQQAAKTSPPAPREEAPVEAKPTIETPAPPSVEPPFDLGDLTTAPALNAYAAEAKKGADSLIRLAMKLEEAGAAPRALLAWERVLDFGRGDTIQSAEALKAIRRLRPGMPWWNVDPEGALPLTVHLGASPAMAEKLKPVLPNVARAMERASGGIVAVTTDVTVGKKSAAGSESSPVALWLSGGPKDSPATEVLSFTVEAPEKLEKGILSTVFQLVRSKLSLSPAYGPPPGAGQDDDPAVALGSNITRFCWQDFAKAMNILPPAPTVVPSPSPAKGKPAAIKPAVKPKVKPGTAAKPPAASPARKPSAKPSRNDGQE